MSLRKGLLLCLLLAVYLQPGTSNPPPPPLINLPHGNPRPLVLIQKLISGHTSSLSPVDRRKAVTIGGGRWLRPLTFQVPDVISNLIPSSSNIIKVHEDPKNNKTAAAPEQKPNPFEQHPHQQMPMMAPYDPLQLITGFDQNGFLKGIPATGAGALGPGFPFANASMGSPFAFDESQMADMQTPLFSMPPTGHHHHFPSAQMAPMNEKPFQMPLFDQDDQAFQHSTPLEMSRPKKQQQFYQDFYSQNEPDLRQQSNQHRLQLSEEQSKQSYAGDLGMSESFRHKEFFQSSPSGYQGDYFPREPHRRLPPTGSGNYDYSQDPFDSNRNNFYSSMPENEMQSSADNIYTYSKKSPASIGFAGGPSGELQFDSGKNNQRQRQHQLQQGSSALRPFFVGQHAKSEASTERPHYRDFSPMLSGSFGNDSKVTSADLTAASEFYAQHLSKSPGDGEGFSGSKMEGTSSLFDGSLEQSEPAGYNSYFNSAGFQAAASMLKPVVVKSEASPSQEAQDFPSGDKMLSLLAANGVNVFPSAANNQRPVASRLKDFLSNWTMKLGGGMLTQKY